ncbi:M20 family metallopeptidase [Candidatus Clostridium stratigraminis]|uniref:M20 family metallopeptidase n=1 Tax=Candidatus Clostridium stratigraminis TaxID=3381661 RepID=A0ABW8T418_9CLOT
MDIKKLIDENIDTLKELRKKLNENAELSHKEFKTQEIIIKFCKDLGLKTEKLAGTGVVAILNEGESCIAIRADMDALPVNGISHACGHDYHMAIVCGTALILKKLGYKKCVKFIFQPAEEADGGALPMIKGDVLLNPSVTSMIGFHVWPEVKVGTIEVSSGPTMASVDDFHIKFIGKGGHAAMPHLCKNPLYPAIDFIETMNLKSRIETDPLSSHTITFSSLQCGDTPNVIANECLLKGTVRTFNKELRNKIHEDIFEFAALAAKKYGCISEIYYDFQYPPLICDNLLTKSFIDLAKNLIGQENVLPAEKTFASEDFAFFAEKIPSVHFRLGISDKEKGHYPLHSPYFNASEDVLFNGIYLISAAITS